MTATDPLLATGTTDGVEPLYRLEGVERVYRRGATPVHALRGVDLTIHHGGMTAIVGPSGSGKSTLLQLLGALDRPTSGTVTFEGVDLGRAGNAALTRLRAAHIGFVFQQFNLIPTLTALDNVTVAMAPHGVRRARRRQRAEELLAQVGLADRAGHLPSKLSGGEQQRVAMARALANAPRVVLADEPTGNLDERTAADVMTLLAALVREQAATVVVITHSPDVATYADAVVRLRDGRVEHDEED